MDNQKDNTQKNTVVIEHARENQDCLASKATQCQKLTEQTQKPAKESEIQITTNGQSHDSKNVSRKRPRNENDCPIKRASKQKKIFQYGNYDRYYGYRNINETPKEDVRLQAFIAQKEMISGKQMLDIGCNNGSLTLLIAKHCHPVRTLGIDIDGDLIGSARRHQSNMLKLCCDDQDAFDALKRVEFRKANYIYQDESLLASEKPQFDVILCLSVTKWVHLNFGDAAVKLIFKRVYRQLNEGGIFILEAQPWSSYRKKKKLTDAIFEQFKSITFRPDEFNRYLLSDEINFREMFELKVNDHAMKGFRRPIYAFRK